MSDARQGQADDGKESAASATNKIWTTALSESFYKNIKRLPNNNNKSVCPPKNYRISNRKRFDSGAYALHYEEELHLANHVAFLAHYEEGVEFVSAVTIEESGESLNPPSLTVRLAANETPTTDVSKDLKKILIIVADHANEGRKADEYKSKLFDQVVQFSKTRIYARLRSSKWRMPSYYRTNGKARPRPLHEMIKRKLVDSYSVRNHSGQDSYPRAALLSLADSMKKVETGPEDGQVELLKEVVRNSWQVSNRGSSKSLETTLKDLGLGITITESREVLEIDKLSKYLQLCNDLIRLSRQPTTREHFKNLRLEVCSSYDESKPIGASELCFVHSEVQLILFYEREPRHPLPRAIGSSKSACFLCDLFIKYHGGFGISHSHMSLTTRWTIPEVSWMSVQQVGRIQGIIRDMDSEIRSLLGKKVYPDTFAIQSRAHLLQIEKNSSIAPSVGSPAISETHTVVGSPLHTQSMSPVPSPIGSVVNKTVTRTLYYFQDLPINIKIDPSIISCTLLAGKVDYLFDLELVQSGHLLVKKMNTERDISEKWRVNVRELSLLNELSVKDEEDTRILDVCVHDAEQHELQITFMWG